VAMGRLRSEATSRYIEIEHPWFPKLVASRLISSRPTRVCETAGLRARAENRMSRWLAIAGVMLGGLALCACKADRKQMPEPRIEVIDVGRLPPGLPEVPRSPDDYFPARPSTEEERGAYWRAQETRDETLCAQAGPRWVSRCMAHVAKLKADSSLCEQIDEAHRWARSSCSSGAPMARAVKS
jgi:hypothetical protein